MSMSKRLCALLVVGVLLACAGSAAAAFPNYSDCPRSAPGIISCLDVQSRSGSLEIKGFTVPLGESLELRGGLTLGGAEGSRFIPARGTNGFFARSIRVPGGLLGLELPIPGNTVLATPQLAGSTSDVVFRFGIPVTRISMPVKVKLDNPILGSSCFIGTNSNPSHINLTTGTTSPPPPNRPISGSLGTAEVIEEANIVLRGARSVDNAFAVAGATGCGLLGLANPLVNLKLQLPSAAGNNTMILVNDVGLQSVG